MNSYNTMGVSWILQITFDVYIVGEKINLFLFKHVV